MEKIYLELETWRDIEGYEGLYEVSNFGRVRSWKNNRWGKSEEPKFLKAVKDRGGYLEVGLCKNGKVKCFLVHRLVANVFIPNPLNLPQVNHKDEDKTNNQVENLEWCDAKYNVNYGTHNQQVAEKLSKAVISTDKNGVEEYFPSMSDAARHGFNQGNICNCLKGRYKTHGGRTWRYA